VLIPAFALGRAQEIAALFNDFFEQGLIDPFPVRVDGLTKPICEVYNDHREYLLGRLGTKSGHLLFGDHVQPMPDGFYPTARPIAALPPMCIISSSGMLLDGTRSAGYAAVLLENAADAVLFSGYLDDESPGSRLRGLQKTTGQVRLNGQSVTVRAEVGRYHLSAHAPGRDLRQMMRAARPRQIILVHGDYSYAPDATFVDFCLTLEREGVHVHQTANGIPIYL
jgi:Cft2 family RNA processing exonuclease